MSIEGITLEHFSALPKTGINVSTKSCQRHAVFHSFFHMIANNIMPLIMQAKRVYCNSKRKSIDVIIKYNMGKY